MHLELRHYTLTETYWIRLKARNGQILMASETYYKKSNAVRAAKRLALLLKLPVRVSSSATH